jgi:hypothetical protein
VKKKHAQELQKLQSKCEADSRVTEQKNQKNIDRRKVQLYKVKKKLIALEQHWADKLDKLDAELSTANDLVVTQKSQYCQLMKQQMDEAKEVSIHVQNYEESFLQENNDLHCHSTTLYLYSKLQNLQENQSLILDENFMMNIFEDYQNKLPPFKEYWELMNHKKQMKVVCRTDGSSVVHYNHICNRLFRPTKKSDVETTDRVIKLSEVATEALVQELLDEKKATQKY